MIDDSVNCISVMNSKLICTLKLRAFSTHNSWKFLNKIANVILWSALEYWWKGHNEDQYRTFLDQVSNSFQEKWNVSYSTNPKSSYYYNIFSRPKTWGVRECRSAVSRIDMSPPLLLLRCHILCHELLKKLTQVKKIAKFFI